MKELIKKAILKSYETKENIFDILMSELCSLYEKSAHTLQEIKDKESKQVKGFFFEELCFLYLQTMYKTVYLLKNIPEDVRKKLGLRKMDFGIDIICTNDDKTYCAVQCKYRKLARKKKNIITWKMLSTFYALCLKTGPYDKYIVMTNADYITHMGEKSYKDKSICIGTWRNINIDTWMKMASMEPGHILSSLSSEQKKTIEELRKIRLEALGL